MLRRRLLARQSSPAASLGAQPTLQESAQFYGETLGEPAGQLLCESATGSAGTVARATSSVRSSLWTAPANC